MLLLPILLAAEPPRATCPPGAGPAVQVEVTGFKHRRGQVRVRVFGDPPSSYFDKTRALTRIEVPVPATGPVRFCVPVPRPGLYAVDIRHDANENGKTDRADGGGASGNPDISLFDMLFGRHPDPAKVQVEVGRGAAPVAITLKYLQGGAFRPWRG